MLKLLGDGRLYTADNLLRKNYANYLDVMKIIRQEYDTQVLEYVVDKQHSTVMVRIQETGKVLVTLSADDFTENARALFTGIKNISGSSIPAPDSVCEFAKVIYVEKPKAPAVKALKKQFGGKNDIFIEVRDGETSIVSVMGFSIKSKFAQSPTLFNAGSSSQFLFKLPEYDDAKMENFNSLLSSDGKRSWEQCKNLLQAEKIEYARPQNPIYSNNLFLVRESMDKIMAWCVKDRLIDSGKDFGVKETVERMVDANPLNVPNPDIYYTKAIKDFLMAGFTGMTAGKKWDGKEQVNGGYIVVMDDGDVICYHSNDRESFRDYLYRNTHFEYVSTKKYLLSYIKKENNEYLLPLNVSIRFNTHTR
ncbi:MAG: HpaII family restriction endonuclease [Firmicutes bacterium]|nr:HpaII family restriction endonuclease [Bacillota bacterium]